MNLLEIVTFRFIKYLIYNYKYKEIILLDLKLKSV